MYRLILLAFLLPLTTNNSGFIPPLTHLHPWSSSHPRYLFPVGRYISILPVIPVTLHLGPQEAPETPRHPQDARLPPDPIPKFSSPDLQAADLTLYK